MQNHGKAERQESAGMVLPDLRQRCQIKQAEAVAFVKRLAIATTSTYPGVERRHEPRVSTNAAAWMQVLNPLLHVRLVIRVLDVSRNGLKISTRMQLQRGTLVQVYIRNIIAMGEVRHCVKVGDEFHAGVQLDDVIASRFLANHVLTEHALTEHVLTDHVPADHPSDDPWNPSLVNPKI